MVGQELVISLRLEQPSLAREDFGPAPQAYKKVDRGSRLERLLFTKKGSRPAPQASEKGRRVPEWRRAPGAGWKILSLGLPQYLVAPLLVKSKKMRTRWLISFITLTHENASEASASNGRLILPSRWFVRLINTQPVRVLKCKR